jgi:hypothetical protein
MRIPANLATVNIPIRTVCWLLLLLPFIIIYIQSQLQYVHGVYVTNLQDPVERDNKQATGNS